jgi:hypothetical protein
LKQLHDTDYVKPDQNERVHQDTLPKRKAVFNDALKRFEEQLQNQDEMKNTYL